MSQASQLLIQIHFAHCKLERYKNELEIGCTCHMLNFLLSVCSRKGLSYFGVTKKETRNTHMQTTRNISDLLFFPDPSSRTKKYMLLVKHDNQIWREV